MKRTGAQIVWECLIREGIDVIFGYPGGAILPTYDALSQYPQIHHVLVRHEQNAAHMADGYSRASGKVGVCIATSGPGATNLVTGLATAMMDSSPLVAITGQVTTKAIGSDAFQETDVTGVTLPVTKHNYLVTDVADLAKTFKEAFHIARTGRKGPVLIDIPKDVQNATTEFEYPETISLPGYRPNYGLNDTSLRAAADLINRAKRPLILAGHGITLANAQVELLELAGRANIPISTTLLGISCIPESHPLALGMMGMHGEAYVNLAIQGADVLIALGMRFDDRVTGNLKTYAQNADVIHVDIDPAEINKNVPATVGISGDVKEVTQYLLPLVTEADHKEWWSQIETWRNDTRERDIINADLPDDILIAPTVIKAIWEETQGNITMTTDVGQHQMWEAQYFRHDRQNQLITSGGLGTMGFGLPSAMGVKFARPNDEVWTIVGDGGFQMSIPELATIMQERLNVKIAIINNAYLGMVRQWQELMYDRRYNETFILGPDFVKLADAYDMLGLRAKTRAEMYDIIRQARSHHGPVLMEFVVEEETNVFPMVSPGRSLHEMIRREKAKIKAEFEQEKVGA